MSASQGSHDKLKARDHVTLKSTRDGLVERNATTGEYVRVRKKETDFELGRKKPDQETFFQVGNRSVQKNKRRQQYHHAQADAAHGLQSPQRDTREIALSPDAPLAPESDFAYNEGSVSETTPLTDLQASAEPSIGQNRPSSAKARQKRQIHDHHANRQNAESDSHETHTLTAEKPNKLQFSQDEARPDAPRSSPNRKLDKAQAALEKTAARLERAKGKLPQKRKLSAAHVFDEKSGIAKRKLHFETEVKSQAEHLKGPLPLRPLKIAGNSVVAFGHRKIYQVQDENVGIEAAHKGEMMVEGGARVVLRHYKTAPYRKVTKLERRVAKKSVNLSYQKIMAENPKLKRNLLHGYGRSGR